MDWKTFRLFGTDTYFDIFRYATLDISTPQEFQNVEVVIFRSARYLDIMEFWNSGIQMRAKVYYSLHLL